jgi:hypothetical protein
MKAEELYHLSDYQLLKDFIQWFELELVVLL